MLATVSRTGTRSSVVADAASDSTPFTSVSPIPTTARTIKVYAVPFLRPVTVWLLVAAPLSAMAVQLPPSCWTSQPVTSSMAVQPSVTLPSPAVALKLAGFSGWMPMVNVLSVDSVAPSESLVSVAV